MPPIFGDAKTEACSSRRTSASLPHGWGPTNNDVMPRLIGGNVPTLHREFRSDSVRQMARHPAAYYTMMTSRSKHAYAARYVRALRESRSRAAVELKVANRTAASLPTIQDLRMTSSPVDPDSLQAANTPKPDERRHKNGRRVRLGVASC